MERLLTGGNGHVLLRRPMGEEFIHFTMTDVPWVAPAVKMDKALVPWHIGLLSLERILLQSGDGAELTFRVSRMAAADSFMK